MVWWASSTPLENGSLARANDLDLLLNSLGPRDGHHFYWDESLHGEIRTAWSYAAGPALTILWYSLPILGLLIVFSFSRRSGPVRDLPAPARATPIEFLEALGSLYRNAGAASTAVSIAWERFRRQSLRALRTARQSQWARLSWLRQFAAAFPRPMPDLEADLAACEDAAWGESDQTTAMRSSWSRSCTGTMEKLMAATKHGRPRTKFEDIHSKQQERA